MPYLVDTSILGRLANAHLVTFNVAHFTRMAGFGPGVVIVDPATV
jgi:hypothetical protein